MEQFSLRLSMVQNVSHLWISDRQPAALSQTVLCDLGLLSFYFLHSEAFSDLSVVFCNAIHSHNLENELFILKVGCVIMSLNPSTALPTAHVQVLMSD